MMDTGALQVPLEACGRLRRWKFGAALYNAIKSRPIKLNKLPYSDNIMAVYSRRAYKAIRWACKQGGVRNPSIEDLVNLEGHLR